MSNTIATLAAAAIAASLTLSGTAFAAQGAHWTDGQYLAAARCEGLMSSAALGKEDDSAVVAAIKAQSGGRVIDIDARADEARTTAERQAAHAGPQQKAALIAERDSGMCASLAAGASTASISKAPTSN